MSLVLLMLAGAGVDGHGPGMAACDDAGSELELLVEAGLSPAQALRATTVNAALAPGATDSLGSVAPRRLADLVLLDGNPLVDIRNTRRIVAVVLNGRYLDREALDGLLAQPASATGVSRRRRGAGKRGRSGHRAAGGPDQVRP